MKKFYFVVLLSVLCGCASTQEATPPDLSGLTHRFISLQQVHGGMTLEEIQAVLGKQVIVGYELVDEKAGQFKPIVVNNPYRRETVKKYDVAYFFVGIKKADDQITDDELVPLVFKNGRLVGIGWPYLEARLKIQPKNSGPAAP